MPCHALLCSCPAVPCCGTAPLLAVWAILPSTILPGAWRVYFLAYYYLLTCSQHARCCRLMEVVVATLGRWADTYLLSEEPACPSLDAAFGAGLGPGGGAGGGPAAAPLGHHHHLQGQQAQHAAQQGQHAAQRAQRGGGGGGGPEVLEVLVRLLLAALTRFPGETALHEVGGGSCRVCMCFGRPRA